MGPLASRDSKSKPGGRSGIARRAWVLGLGLALLACGGERPGSAEEFDDGWIKIGDQRIALEIVRTPDEQRLGLGERDSLDWGNGMLFQYDTATFPKFWMKGMRFDIDIIWIRDGRIVEISNQVPHVPGQNGPTVSPRSLTDSVLEVPSGFAQANRLHPGQRVKLEIFGE